MTYVKTDYDHWMYSKAPLSRDYKSYCDQNEIMGTTHTGPWWSYFIECYLPA